MGKAVIMSDVKGITVTKLENGKWMADILFGPLTITTDGKKLTSAAPGWRGEYTYPELRNHLRERYDIGLPLQEYLIYVGKSCAGTVYTPPYNTYLGEDLLNNTYRFIR